MWTLVSLALTVGALKWALAAAPAAAEGGDDPLEPGHRVWWRNRLALLLVTPMAMFGAASMIGAAGTLGSIAWMVGMADGDVSGIFFGLFYALLAYLPTLVSAAAVWQYGRYLLPADSSDEAWPRWARWLAACALIASMMSAISFLVQPLYFLGQGDISGRSDFADGAGYLVWLTGFAWALTGSRRLASWLQWIVLPTNTGAVAWWVFRIALATAFGQTLLGALTNSYACVAGQVPGLQGFDEAAGAQWCSELTHLFFAAMVLLILRPRFLALARAWHPGPRWSAGEQLLAWSAGLSAASALVSMAKGTWISAMGPLTEPLWRIGDWVGDSGPWGLLEQYAPQAVLLLTLVWLLKWRPPGAPQAGGADPGSGGDS